jgi:transcriptional antiterminator NusG
MSKNWYVVHIYSGFEDKVKSSIEENVSRKHIEDKIGRILIPSEQVVELKKGIKKESRKKYYPGYILVEMELDDDVCHLIKNTPKVAGFVGGSKPIPVLEDEVNVILQQVEKGVNPQVEIQYNEGDKVRIKDGPFSSFTGVIDGVDKDHERLTVMVTIFGRQTPVELDYFQVEKE